MTEELADYLGSKGMRHVRGAPYHPQTQDKIERWYQMLKNRILQDNYNLPSHLEYQIGAFIRYYNHQRYHESLNNLTPADIYFGKGAVILEQRKKIKHRILKQRRSQHHANAA